LLAAVVDVRAEAARGLAERFGCPAYGSADALLADRPALDAAILCTPPCTHHDLSVRFVRRGWHVLCEKPFSLDVASARAMVQAVEGKRVQRLPVEDTVRICVRSAGGVLGSIDLSWSLSKGQDAYLTLHGSRGTLLVGWRESKYRLHAAPGWVVFGSGYDKVQAFRSQLVNFARAIRGEEALVVGAEDALASVQVVAAAYRSLRRSHWTAVPPRGRKVAVREG